MIHEPARALPAVPAPCPYRSAAHPFLRAHAVRCAVSGAPPFGMCPSTSWTRPVRRPPTQCRSSCAFPKFVSDPVGPRLTAPAPRTSARHCRCHSHHGVHTEIACASVRSLSLLVCAQPFARVAAALASYLPRLLFFRVPSHCPYRTSTFLRPCSIHCMAPTALRRMYFACAARTPLGLVRAHCRRGHTVNDAPWHLQKPCQLTATCECLRTATVTRCNRLRGMWNCPLCSAAVLCLLRS